MNKLELKRRVEEKLRVAKVWIEIDRFKLSDHAKSIFEIFALEEVLPSSHRDFWETLIDANEGGLESALELS